MTTEYQRAFVEALLTRHHDLRKDGHQPKAIRLMPTEVKLVADYFEAHNYNLGSFVVSPTAGVCLLGMAVIESNKPIAITERFVFVVD